MRIHFIKAVLLATMLVGSVQAATEAAPVKLAKSTADHSKFKELNRAFDSGPEVTKACLACHTEASKQIHQTQHWTWQYTNPKTQQVLGKKTVVNNFCALQRSGLQQLPHRLRLAG